MTATGIRPYGAAATRGGAGDGIRLDIQGLRAIAVGLVVIYHLWPWHVTGGYVGVDVFFVISGFLITSHMVREVERSGTVSLPRFWARRARRLLPASLLVLAVTLLAIAVTVPRSLWEQFIREVAASTLYIANWALAIDAVDYLAADNVPSPVQHFWSLSVEEQFYLVWPLLVVVAIALLRRRPRAAIAAMLGAVTAASFAYSLWVTAAQPAQAYFVTPARAWEFGAGALLALVPVWRASARVRAATAWGGLVLIGIAALAFDERTPFPGFWAVLPVVGTVAFIAARGDDARLGPVAVLGNRPVQMVGELSYSIYLWHWGVIVIAPYALGRDLLAADKLVVVVAVVALSYATWRWVENPMRRVPWLVDRRPRWTFLLTVVGMGLLVGLSWWAVASLHRQVDDSLARAHQLALDPAACVGARPAVEGCAPLLPDDDPVPIPAAARADSPEDCLASKAERVFEPCEFGTPRDEATATVALVGDSHAYHWLPALEQIALERGWHGVVMARESCPFTPAQRTLSADVVEGCTWWNAQVTQDLEARDDLSVVVLAAYSAIYFDAPDGEDERAFARESYRAAIDGLPAQVEEVLVIRDAPRPRADNVECVELALTGIASGDVSGCAVDRDEALVEDMLAAAAADSARAEVLDLSDAFCDAERCSPVAGGVVAYADQGHLTRTFVWSAADAVARALS